MVFTLVASANILYVFYSGVFFQFHSYLTSPYWIVLTDRFDIDEADDIHIRT